MSTKKPYILGIVTIVSIAYLSTAAQGAIPASEREALIALYTSANGDNWSNISNWRKSPEMFNDPGTECDWHGVTCAADGSTVSGLKFLGNRLTGTIPPEFGNLGNLQSLSLAINQLAGSIPSELGNLTNLQTLLLQTNQLAGDIAGSFHAKLKAEDGLANRHRGAVPNEVFGDQMERNASACVCDKCCLDVG